MVNEQINELFPAASWQIVLDDWGRQVSHIPVTRTNSNITGQETITEGSPSNIQAYFVRTNQLWNFQKAGFLEKGDAIMISKYSDSVVTPDRVSADGQKYRIAEAFDVPGTLDNYGSGTVMVFTVCRLVMIE